MDDKNGYDVKIVTCIYRRNLKMTPGKLAAQVAHAVSRIRKMNGPPDRIIVLKASDKRFLEEVEMVKSRMQEGSWYIHTDEGLTELSKDTQTVLAWLN